MVGEQWLMLSLKACVEYESSPSAFGDMCFPEWQLLGNNNICAFDGSVYFEGETLGVHVYAIFL